MLYLISTIMVIIIAIAAAVLLRPRRTRRTVPGCPVIPEDDTAAGSGVSDMDSVLAGQMLAYLVGNFLIDSQQYQAWRSLSPEELKLVLEEAGIMTGAEFDSFNLQLAAEAQVQQARGECNY
ncbi:hypothetical protein [Sporomusa paucivorans]|uniref:hypothetical protein n=1 Tax=Sporomusa paucivorans TaxID=2376 RepID=UPI0035713428